MTVEGAAHRGSDAARRERPPDDRRGRDRRDRGLPPEPDGRLRLGTRVRLTGVVGKAWGAPRLKVTRGPHPGERARPIGTSLKGSPTAATEWRLVRVTGTITDVHRSGDRWTAELATSGTTKLLLSGLAGSGDRGQRRHRGAERDGDRDREASVPDRDGPALRDRPPAAVRPRARAGRGRFARRDGRVRDGSGRVRTGRRRPVTGVASAVRHRRRPRRRPPRPRGEPRRAGPDRRDRHRDRGRRVPPRRRDGDRPGRARRRGRRRPRAPRAG